MITKEKMAYVYEERQRGCDIAALAEEFRVSHHVVRRDIIGAAIYGFRYFECRQTREQFRVAHRAGEYQGMRLVRKRPVDVNAIIKAQVLSELPPMDRVVASERSETVSWQQQIKELKEGL